jgi:hypothetical protein
MSTDIPLVNAAYVVVVNEDGTMRTILLKAGEVTQLETKRDATTYDVFTASKAMFEDIEQQLLAERISKAVIEELRPADEQSAFKERLIEALTARKSQ